MFDPLQPGDLAFEWIELFNASGLRLELTGWKIRDNYLTDPIPDLVLEPGAYAVVAASPSFGDGFPDFSGIVVFVADGRIGNGLANTGDRIIIEDSAGNVIDAISYGTDTYVLDPPLPRVDPGHSLERQITGQQGAAQAPFADNSAPSPGRGLA